MEKSAAELFAEREKRFNDVVALRKPDRVPVIPIVNYYFPTKIRGISNMTAGYDRPGRQVGDHEAASIGA